MNVLFIAGFLGSGKTTALLEVARAMVEDGLKLAIIENEIGEVGIDGGYVREQGLPVQSSSAAASAAHCRSGSWRRSAPSRAGTHRTG